MYKFFTDHPRFSAVISIVVTVAGLLAAAIMPVSQYPDIVPPNVVVTATFPGANATTMQDTVGVVLEREINGVEDMIYMKSTASNDGSYQLVVTFKVGADPDKAQTLTQNRVNKALPKLPEDVRRQGISVEKESPTILQVVTVTSEADHEELFLANYASLNVVDALLRVPGVGKAEIMNIQDYAARIWLDPIAMHANDVVAQDVIAAVSEQNFVAAAGSIGAAPSPDQDFTYTLQTKGRMANADEFSEIVLRAEPNGKILMLSDVARFELGAEFAGSVGKVNGQAAAVLAIYQQPGANALDVAEGVRHAMATVSQSFPAGLQYDVPYDATTFVEVSIHEVIITLFIAVALVTAVTYVFLQNLRATLIPLATIPPSLVGTFGVMLALGYSINLISLLAMILAIGVVVDAAIIVLEDVERVLAEKAVDVRTATLEAMQNVGSPLIAGAAVLLAVFGPVSLMPGMVGIIYAQFGVVLSMAVLISTIVAVTLVPALCVLLLDAEHKQPPLFLRKFNDMLNWITRGYVNLSDCLSRRLPLALVLYAGLIGGVYGLATNMPTGFVPSEDQGSFFVEVQLPDAAAVGRTSEVVDAMAAEVRAIDGVRDVITLAGGSLLEGATVPSAGIMIVALEHWDQREASQREIFIETAAVLETFDEALVLPFESPTIPGMGNSAGFEFVLQDTQGRSPVQMAEALDVVLAEINAAPELAYGFSTFRAEVPQKFVDLDRVKSKMAGVRVDDVFTTMQAQLGGYFVNDITMFGKRVPVMVQADAEYRNDDGDLRNTYVRAQTGEVVPISSLVDLKDVTGPQTLTSYNLYGSVVISGEPAEGFSSGDAIEAMERIASTALGNGFSFEWTGQTYQETEAGSTAGIAFALAMLFAFLIMAAQYESWAAPLAILLVVPTALLGTFLHTWAAGGDISLYTQIGLVLMIGMAARNAILIVDVAKKRVDAGEDLVLAAKTAAQQRFRPLLMTALAVVLGATPLVLAGGAGAGALAALGQAVFGGMVTAVLIGAVFTAPLYVLIMRLRGLLKRSSDPDPLTAHT
ncbi:HAE1 family hydrophobic/amphiphilic exporter-1 [Shimia isoporae]|uniref:Efflux pump membrane transporter n=1 Tax=Shimia isoporae TaxID=647720 RepID=A0A4R1N2B5_9RHOB|nr:efflux RND transporter permease subunit [Shimia isoporae]TCL00348.1 HAE1 family hydrophobic/amphiphilic exporter-1 [Shimia isoporae]